jgi:ABC-type oligopeptide transport system substrate-binding subunit
MKRMKTPKLIIAALVVAALAGVVVGVSGCKEKASSQTGGQTVKYTCSMHPEVVQDKAGSCPKCGMALVEKR